MYINNGKQPDESYNAALGFWLPPDSPYGNFQLKHIKIIQRLDEANRHITESHQFWNLCHEGGMITIGGYERHIFANEEAIYMLRRAADVLVSLVWCLSKYEQNGHYPSQIKIDSLGAVLAQADAERPKLFSDHLKLMRILNDIANAFKHSFINSDHTLIGAEEPRIHALGLTYNKLKFEPQFYDVALSALVDEYNIFYKNCVSWLSSYSKRNR